MTVYAEVVSDMRKTLPNPIGRVLTYSIAPGLVTASGLVLGFFSVIT